MKKILKYLLLVVVLGGFPFYQTKATEYKDTFNDNAEWINAYIVKEKEGKRKYQQMTLMVRNRDHQFVYCIEPGTPINGNTVMTGTDMNQAYIANMSKEEWQKIELLAYYGYGYENHTDIKWYTITQFLIWKTVPHGYDIYFTDTLNGKRINKYEKEIKELEELVENHTKIPSFSNQKITMQLGETKKIIDEKGVLSSFQIEQCKNIESSIHDNVLEITAKTSGKEKIILTKREQNLSHPAIIYIDPNSQNVMVRGAYEPISINLDVEIPGGSITIQKKDKDTNSNQPLSEYASLKNASYGVYDNNDKRIATVTTKEDGTGTCLLPKLGTYYLKEEIAPTGYELDKEKYYFEITKDTLNQNIEVYDRIIKAHVTLTKVLGTTETGILTPEANIEFGVYDENGNLYQKGKTDKQGKLDIIVPFGKWEIRQLTTTPGYAKVKPFKIDITNSQTQEFILYDEEIKAKLKITKIDAETKKTIPLAGIKFKIKNRKTNEYICQMITYPTTQTICEYETNEEGILITPNSLPQGIYQLEEVEQRIEGYLWNKIPLKFEIKDTSNFLEHPTYGTILELNFENNSVKGEIEVEKWGEELQIQDGSYTYQKKLLDNVTFELFAQEDIKRKDGTILYKKDKKVTSFKTINGYYKIENLPLGKYYLKEIESIENHIISFEKQEITLSYQDQYTPVVSTKIKVQNNLPKATLIFRKTDKDNNQPIKGTKIEIYTKENQLIFCGETDINGQIILNNLFLGEFYLLEKEAAPGYQLSTERINFSTSKNQEIISIGMTNHLTVKVPNTEIHASSLSLEVLFIIILSSMGAIIYGKKS